MINKHFVKSEYVKPYYTLGEYSDQTKNIWFVFHGYGQLSEFFSKNFEGLASNDTFIIIPQAPSKFYNGFGFDKVGSSWLTKNELEEETQNNLNYLESIVQREAINLKQVKINGFGFSQGVSMLVRWLAYKSLSLDKLVLWAGQFPKKYINLENLQSPKMLYFVIGNNDPLKEQFNLKEEIAFVEEKLQTNVNYIEYEGGHKVDKEIISNLFND